MVKDARGRTEVFLSDLHFPSEDRAAVTLAKQVVKAIQPDTIIYGGDIIDMYSVSRHDRDPRRKLDLQRDLDYTAAQLAEFRALAPGANQVFIRGNHECFDDATEVLTGAGWRLFSVLDGTESVGTYNTSTDRIEFQVPSSISVSRYVGTMTRIVARHCDLLITPNHRLLFKNLTSKAKWHLKPANEVTRGRNRIVMASASASGNSEYLLSDDEIRIAAWILTDGCLDHCAATIYQRPSKVHLITEILDRLGWDYTRRERQRNVTAICGKVLKKRPEPECVLHLVNGAAKFAAYLLNHTKKVLPRWVFELSDRQFEVFLHSYIDGDGSRHKSAPETSLMAYGRKMLLDDLQRACLTHGYRTSLAEYRPGAFRLNIHKSLFAAIDGFGRYVDDEVDYDGFVYCATTANDTLVVRRNGKISITGNTRLTRYLSSKAEELSVLDALSLPALLKLNELEITLQPEGQFLRSGHLFYLHGHEVAGGGINVARQKLLKAGSNVLFGHHHRAQFASARNLKQQEIGAWASGCLCDLKPDWLPVNDWLLGFSVIHFSASGSFQVEQVVITKPTSKSARARVSGVWFDA